MRTPVAAPPAVAGAPEPADFAAIEIPAINAQMWPVHAMAWLQPELSAAALPSSGLRPERRHRVPAPDFLPPVAGTAGSVPPVEHRCEAMAPAIPGGIPACGLSPLGWEPRAEAPR